MPSSPEQALRNELAQARAHIGVVEGFEQQTTMTFEQRLQGVLSLTGERDNEMVASLRQKSKPLNGPLRKSSRSLMKEEGPNKR